MGVGFLVLVVGFSSLVRLVDADGEYELITEKSPATVRSEFLGSDPPAMALTRSRANDVTEKSDRFEYEVSVPFGGTRVYGYEATETDDGLRLALTWDAEQYSEQRLTIRSEDGETVISVSSSAPKQRPGQYLLQKLRDRYYKRALAIRGYDFRPVAE